MNVKELKLGIRIELEIIDSEGKPLGYSYVSQLLDIIDDRRIAVAQPIRESRVIFLPHGSRVRAVLVDDKQNLITFTGLIRSQSEKETVAALLLDIEGELEKVQRRQFFRVSCILDADYRVVAENPGDFIKCMTKDMSGSGVCILTAAEIPKGSDVEVMIYLSEEVRVKAVGRVMRCWIDESGKNKYRVGLHFMKISTSDRELIIKYLFDIQRDLLKRGFK